MRGFNGETVEETADRMTRERGLNAAVQCAATTIQGYEAGSTTRYHFVQVLKLLRTRKEQAARWTLSYPTT